MRSTELEAAVRALRAGGVVAFPTETVYGLGADARNAAGLQRVFDLKRRPRSHPLIVHLRAGAGLREWTRVMSPAAIALAAKFWPGPLTLVLPRAAGVLDLVTGGQDTVAVRIPSHPIAQQLLADFDGGIAAPSANRYGHVSPTCAAHVREEFGAEAPQVIDGGDCELGLESAIVDCSGPRPRLLRPGSIGVAALRAVAPMLQVGAVDDSPRVPGVMLAHYAPGTPLSLVATDELESRATALARAGQSVAVLARHPPRVPLVGVHWLDAGDVPTAFGHSLYANLRALDKLGCARILVQQVPAGAAWDAVRDRLQRAAAGREWVDNDTLGTGVLP